MKVCQLTRISIPAPENCPNVLITEDVLKAAYAAHYCQALLYDRVLRIC